MTTPFDPTLPVLGDGTSGGNSTQHILPNGQYDIYNLGALWNKTLYLGNTTSEPAHVDTSTLQGIEQASHTTTVPVTATPLDYIKEFAGWSVTNPDQFAALQQQLFTAGFYGSKKPRLGVYSPTDATAMKTAITGYLQVVNPADPQPLTLTDYLDHATRQAAKSAQATAPPIPVTDPNSIKQAAMAAFQAATGQGATDAQLNAFVAQFQASQVSAQSATSGVVTSPDLSSEAAAYAQQKDPQAYKQNQRQAFMDSLVNMFAPSGSARPNMTPVASTGG